MTSFSVGTLHLSQDITKGVCAEPRLRSDWVSECLLCAELVTTDLSLLHADSEDSDQTELMPWLI